MQECCQAGEDYVLRSGNNGAKAGKVCVSRTKQTAILWSPHRISGATPQRNALQRNELCGLTRSRSRQRAKAIRLSSSGTWPVKFLILKYLVPTLVAFTEGGRGSSRPPSRERSRLGVQRLEFFSIPGRIYVSKSIHFIRHRYHHLDSQGLL